MNDQERIEYFMSEIARLSNQVVDLQNERDALAAQVYSLKDSINKCKIDNVSLLRLSAELKQIVAATPQQCLTEIRAEAGEIGYYNGFKDALVIDPPLPPATGTPTTIDIFAYQVEQVSKYAAIQYADKVRQGGE